MLATTAAASARALQEDKSLIRTGDAPRVMASIRSLAVSLLRLDGHDNIAADHPPPHPRSPAGAKAAPGWMNDWPDPRPGGSRILHSCDELERWAQMSYISV
jgi:hypothetical protein